MFNNFLSIWYDAYRPYSSKGFYLSAVCLAKNWNTISWQRPFQNIKGWIIVNVGFTETYFWSLFAT